MDPSVQRFLTLIRTHWVMVSVVVALLAGTGIATAVVTNRRGDVALPPPVPASTTETSTPTVPATPKPTATPTKDTRPREPLTGQLTKNPDSLKHPAVAIKISDVREAHPQVGIDKADIVFVEPIGESYTRLAAVFHSELPASVGPIRSIRPMDAQLLGPLKCVFGNTMAAPWVMDYVDDYSDVDNLGTLRVRVSTGAYTIDGGRVPVNNVFAHPETLMNVSDYTAAPKPYFSYGYTAAEVSTTASKKKATTISVPYGPRFSMSYDYDATTKKYLRSEPWGPHVLANGTRVSATNVLIIKVASHVGKIGTASGARVPLLSLNHGKGSFTAVSGGKRVSGTWTKGSENQSFTFTTAAGQPLELAPGNTFVELPDVGAKVSVG